MSKRITSLLPRVVSVAPAVCFRHDRFIRHKNAWNALRKPLKPSCFSPSRRVSLLVLPRRPAFFLFSLAMLRETRGQITAREHKAFITVGRTRKESLTVFTASESEAA